MKSLALPFLALFSLSACVAVPGGSGQIGDACGDLGWGRIGGTLLGAGGGGFLGSQLAGGGRSSQGLAIAIGTLAGAAGGYFAGSSLDRGQCEQARYARDQALNRAPIGQQIAWNTGTASGSFTPIRDGYDPFGAQCREYQSTIYIDGRAETGIGRACRRPNGQWHLVQG